MKHNKFNYKYYWKINMARKQLLFPKMKFKIVVNIFHQIRIWFRWKFNYEYWNKLVNKEHPEWIKEIGE